MYKILVVNDDIDSLRTIVKYVEESNSNYNVLQALNGLTGLKIAIEKQPDLIIADWDMPGMDGITFIRELKKDVTTHDIPVIMATAVMTNSEHLKIALDAGAVDYIRIPVDKVELTARVYSMLELSKSYQQIKELNATKDKFFSIIAHDLRNPFTSMITLSNVVMKDSYDASPDKITKYFKSINESARNGYKLLENLLQWSRTQTGRIKFVPEQLNVDELIGDAIDMVEAVSNDKQIKIETNYEEDLEVVGDKDMLSCILRNLAGNAVKFTPNNGSIRIKAEKVQFNNANPKQNKAVEFKVMDTGVGISEEDINKLFRIDVTHSTPGTNKERGSGLGLILCKEFARRHGGDLSVQSVVGEGSTFSFFVPQESGG